VVIGVHAPEFAFERDPATSPRRCAIWASLSGGNRQRLRHLARLQQPILAGPLFIDAQGKVRYHHFGEGEYARSDR